MKGGQSLTGNTENSSCFLKRTKAAASVILPQIKGK
jgi:hypothetical protein